MRIFDLNWMQLEQYLERDDRIVLPLGSTEQHAYLSLGTDAILAERVSVEAAEPLGVPVLPALAYGVCPSFAAYPGSPSIGLETYAAVLGELIASLRGQGFRRLLLVNGHGGQHARRGCASPATASSGTTGGAHRRSPRSCGRSTRSARTRPGSRTSPGRGSRASRSRPSRSRRSSSEQLRGLDPQETRRLLGDGTFGGVYAYPDEDMLRVWRAGVDEVRGLLEDGWA